MSGPVPQALEAAGHQAIETGEAVHIELLGIVIVPDVAEAECFANGNPLAGGMVRTDDDGRSLRLYLPGEWAQRERNQ